jgi:serine/threonine protein kinase
MYECVTQQTPQRGEPIYSLLRNVTEGRHRPPRELRPDLPPALEAIIERAMSVRPKDRFASVHELGQGAVSLSRPRKASASSTISTIAPIMKRSGPRARAGAARDRMPTRAPPRPSPCHAILCPPGNSARRTPRRIRPSAEAGPRRPRKGARRPLPRVALFLAVGAVLAVAALVVGRACLRP